MNPNISLRACLLGCSSLIVTSLLQGAPLYWDTDGVTPGAGGTTPNGLWSSGGSTWSTDSIGATATAAYTTLSTDDLVFSAGTNATGAYTVTLDSLQDAKSLLFQEGTTTISGAGGIINLGGLGGRITVNNSATGTPLNASIGNNTDTHIAGTQGLTKLGVGSLTLNGSAVNTFTGGLNVNGGTLALNYANLATPTNLIDSSNALTFGGGTLSLIGKSTDTTSQTFGDVTVNSGGGQLLGNKNGGSALNITLGSLTATANGGSLLLGAGGTAANAPVITTTSDKDATGIYGGRTVFYNGTANTGYDWATNTGGAGPDYTLSGYAGYTALALGAGTDTNNSVISANATMTGNRITNSLKFAAPATAQTLTIGAGNTLTLSSGGLLFTGASVAQGPRIAGGSITAGNGSGSYDLVVHSYNATNQNIVTGVTGTNLALITTISSSIVDNGANAVTLVKTGPGSLVLGAANGFTGGIVVNGGSLGLNHANSLNDNALTFNGNSTLLFATMTGNGGITLNNNSQVTMLGNGATFTNNGAVTGSGGITLDRAGLGTVSVVLGSTGNTFTGPIRYAHAQINQSANLTVGSLADTASSGEGNISFGVGAGSTSQNFNYGSSAIAALTLNNRRFELAGSQVTMSINNNSTQAINIDSDLLVTGGSSKFLTLGGAGVGVSTFAGDITDNPTPTFGSTALAAAFSAGASTITLGSVNGIAVGATITGTGIAASTTVTAINTITKQVTLSAVTTGSGALAQAMSVTGVESNVSLTKGGGSVWTLSGANSFSGGVTLSGATLNSQLNINSATALGTGTLTISGGNNARIDNTSGGAIALSSNNAQIWSNDFTFVGSNDLNMGTGAVALGGNRSLTVNGATKFLTVGGIIDDGPGSFSITKNGGGNLILGGANTYNGATIVNSGMLEIAAGGSTHATSAVTVNNTAELVVNGTLNGSLLANANTTVTGTGTIVGNADIRGIHNPGNSPGIQTFGNLSYTGGASTVNWDLAGNTSTNPANPNAAYDQIVVGGNLAFSGLTAVSLVFDGAGSGVLWNDAFWDSAQNWVLYDVDGTTSDFSNLSLNTIDWLDSGSNAFNTARPGSTFSLSQSGENVILNYMIPEPCAALLAGLGLLGLLRRRRI